MSNYHRSLRVISAIRRSICTTSRVARDPLFRPAPPPLPAADQREWEQLMKAAQQPAVTSSSLQREDDIHPDARRKPEPEFRGDVNPATGEANGPKVEPVKHNDWSYAGRVTDF